MSKALFVRELTPQERAGLRRLVRGGTDASAVRRAQMVLLSSRGKTAPEIAPLWGGTGQCVRKVINRFNPEGLAGPARPPAAAGPGNPTTATSGCSRRRCRRTRASWATCSAAGRWTASASTWPCGRG